ncbi:MAG TPA: DUF2723 domain-containing protein [candidate division Zixibacteria bacterium]|nr:DUF2723 domain-containing protein [candidate division Zixibacteria bacterium]
MPSKIRPWLSNYWPVLVLLLIPVLYLLTMARGLVLGDPTEYTFVSNMLGIAHPPGYAFYTLVGKLFQSAIPFGDIPWRMHMTSVAAATLSSLFVYGTVLTISSAVPAITNRFSGLDKAIALFSALSVATAVNLWQHSIHANPHIVTATFLAANLFFLTKWWAKQRGPGSTAADKWLYTFCLSAGLGVTHHPLTVISFLAYGLFILYVRPTIWRDWRTLLKMLGFAALGLLVWLYYPIRSAMEPEFGPHDMNTLDGFLDHVLARGLTESLPFFGLSDIGDRALVFWTLLRLQYSLTSIFLAALGLIWLIWDRLARKKDSSPEALGRGQGPRLRQVGLLFGLALVSNYLFVINLRQQDIMAYLLGCFLIIGLLTGPGVLAIMDIIQRRVKLDKVTVAFLFTTLFLLGPVLQVVRNLPRVSLADYREGDDYVADVFEWFDGQGENAVLLNDWEHMTPLWYSQYVDERWPDPTDVQPRFVSTDRPWLQSVYDYLPGGPVYLSGFKREIVEAGFRLRPRGVFYQVIEPGDSTLPAEIVPIESQLDGEIMVNGFHLPFTRVTSGDYVPLTIAMSTPAGTEDYYTPVLYIGDIDDRLTLEFTTDSHLTTPQWEPGEMIVEQFGFALPHYLPSGRYPLSLGIRNLSSAEDSSELLSLTELEVTGQDHPPATGSLLANFRQRVGLLSAKGRNGLLDRRSAPWSEPIAANPGDILHLTFEWQSLEQAEESYTIFVHLIDTSNHPYVALDYTPLGGSTPTHLWIPKWLPGQRMLDPYQLEIPQDLAPGDYLVEVGLYEMTSGRRLHMSDITGNLIGDRYILGAVRVGD